MVNFKSFYEKYHKDVSLPKRIIDERNFTYRHIVSTINKYCKGKNVFDVGIGVGTLDFYLAKKGKKITGIEISEKAYNIAIKSLKKFNLQDKVEFTRGDFLKTRLHGKYDFVICSEVMEHLENEDVAMKKIYELIKKRGLLMLTVPSINAPLIRLGVIREFDKRSGHLRRYSDKSLRKLIEKFGLKVVTIKKSEGVLRNSLFVFKTGHQVVRLANRFNFISDIITYFDKITLLLFGESQLIAIVKK